MPRAPSSRDPTHRRPTRNRELFEEIPDLLSSLFETADPQVAPAHNDLTIWNLRQDNRGTMWLFDWEDCGLAPLGADETYFRTSLAGVRGRPMPEGLPAEAIRHWRRIVAARTTTSAADKALRNQMLRGAGRGGPRGDRPPPRESRGSEQDMEGVSGDEWSSRHARRRYIDRTEQGSGAQLGSINLRRDAS